MIHNDKDIQAWIRARIITTIAQERYGKELEGEVNSILGDLSPRCMRRVLASSIAHPEKDLRAILKSYREMYNDNGK